MTHRRPMSDTQKDQILPYKAQLEASDGQPWSWQRVAKESGISDETLRAARSDLRSVSLSTLYSIEKFFRSRGVAFAARDALPEPAPISETA